MKENSWVYSFKSHETVITCDYRENPRGDGQKGRKGKIYRGLSK